jgi:hypothetical protein
LDEARLGSEQQVCGAGVEVTVILGGTERDARFREDTEVIDFLAPPREVLFLERLANGHTLSMCRTCDTDAPVRDDTG